MADARFEDGEVGPLNLVARDGDDLAIISALVQDAVLTGADLKWERGKRRFACLVNRFRWEDREAAEAAKRPYERVRALLVIEDAGAVRSQGIDRGDPETVLSILSLGWEAGEDGTGAVTLVLAGDGAVRVEVEALEVTLHDVTKPYVAPSRRKPEHRD
ncbi:DUF2948 family protein [Rhodobacteraceae bacterium HSP-20]|uniref:DUF2948 family protein n=1 Tax=Paragemmobacter amnigenus TaxID=2852097 RepID=A0ABS6J0H4_9RHOB|nr:DUF2948 family protein [Rhodobacter amnigenus]MBU9697228.1 DUF2948 family protein [Rhodobacter amnigenus]MBV4388455.1 DUF2948 family protein [Rhodobacter amnigenus]